jgi:hypothetical protein
MYTAGRTHTLLIVMVVLVTLMATSLAPVQAAAGNLALNNRKCVSPDTLSRPESVASPSTSGFPCF